MESILDLQNQSSLAKLLATENITVTHNKTLSTAYFDVKNRVLGLPVWKDQGKVVYDMLVGHEVSHALYTDHYEFEKFLKDEGRSHFDILNIVEDIRIERLIKLKYAGMPRIFNGAYKKLVEGDFFKVEGKNIEELNFLDRLNLKAKIGPHVDITLSDEELAIFNKCLKAETFEDVVELYHEIKAFIAEEANKKKEEDSDESPFDNQEGDEGAGESADADEAEGEEAEGFGSVGDGQETDDDSDDGEEAEGESAEGDEGEGEASSEDIKSDDDEESSGETTYTNGAGDAGDINEDEDLTEEYRSETLESFENNIQEEATRESYKTDIGMMPLKATIDKCIIPYRKVLAARPNIDDVLTNRPTADDHNGRYIKLKKLVNKRASILAREFERRKASFQYSRAKESRNGTINVNSLHKYMYDDQIFSTTMTLADAKSHGMIFFIDYSGSMSAVLKDVLEHTLNLIQFCKKVVIPFQVYSFTSLHMHSRLDQNPAEFDMSNLVIAELFSSEMKKAEYDQAFKTVAYQILFSHARITDQFTSKYEQLGGTPLDHTLIAAHTIVKNFNRKHAVQKTNVVILSDGDSHHCWPESSKYTSSKLVFSVNRKQYSINRYGATNQLTEVLKKATGATLIGFFLPSGRPAINQKVREMGGYDAHKQNMKKYKKDGYFHSTECKGYDSYFLLPDNIEIDENEFHFDTTEVANDRTAQNQLAKSYAKHNVKNRQNRIILTKFAEMVA